jgi:hypothetical protein
VGVGQFLESFVLQKLPNPVFFPTAEPTINNLIDDHNKLTLALTERFSGVRDGSSKDGFTG